MNYEFFIRVVTQPVFHANLTAVHFFTIKVIVKQRDLDGLNP
jgi:hypothetical protein